MDGPIASENPDEVHGLRDEDLEESGGAFVVAEAMGWGVAKRDLVLGRCAREVDGAAAK